MSVAYHNPASVCVCAPYGNNIITLIGRAADEDGGPGKPRRSYYRDALNIDDVLSTTL